jgi:hypothetical protein
MSSTHIVLHGLAIKKHAAPADIAGLIGLSESETAQTLAMAAAGGRAVEVGGKYMLSGLGRVALDADYSRHYADVRKNTDFMTAYEAFEHINVTLKALITDWQSVEIGGQRVVNDHSNKAYDEGIIDRLGKLHERAEGILAKLSSVVPRMKYYGDGLLEALEKAEDGAIEWISDAKIESYHTLWFELHEDLLRMVGRTRSE